MTCEFSIVVTAYNFERYIGDAIQSVLSQTVADWELIIVDDGSADQSVAVATRFRDPRIQIISQENAGVSAAANRGLAAISGQKVLFLDGDDRLCPTALEQFRDGFRRHPTACAIYGERTLMDESGTPYGKRPVWVSKNQPSGDVLQTILTEPFLTTGGQVCFQSEAVKAVGGYPSDRGPIEDWRLWCRVAATGPFFFVSGAPVLEYRLRQGSMARDFADASDLDRVSIDEFIGPMEEVFSDPAIKKKLDAVDLKKLKYRRETSLFVLKAHESLRAGNWGHARRYLGEILKRDPFRLREILLFVFSVLRWIPLRARSSFKQI